jgi:hypothetical protein
VKRVAVLALAILTLAAACKKKENVAATLAAQNRVAVREVQLFYESAEMFLIPETRSISLPESSPAALPLVVRELMKGPTRGGLRLFPEDTVVRGAYLLPGGTVVVDLGGVTLTKGWGTGSHQELMAAYSLAQTLGSNFADARRVRIVINGGPAETLGGHISLMKSLEPRRDLLDPRFR